MQRIFKFVSGASVVIFMGMLLYVYAFLPEKVGLYYDANEIALWTMGKTNVFYTFLGVFIFVNLITSLLSRSIGIVPVDPAGFIKTEYFKYNLHLWSAGLSFILNLTIIFAIIFIGLYHNDEHFNISYFSFLIYVGPILLTIWIFVLLYFVANRSKNHPVNE